MMGATSIMKQSIFPLGASGGNHSLEHTDRTQTGNKNLDLHPSSAPSSAFQSKPGFLYWRLFKSFIVVLCNVRVSCWQD